ncbi:zf-DHHC domain-containing protein [Cephalotus follicularis]|uniref:S-acyltransferase n=1 Tax=Cephalotus follicularis TaxID=3775 RepID=A0A1Q3AQH8_CEPFO|nr:zf-DHHC domain-containing protein [Cephalotus follicularis]
MLNLYDTKLIGSCTVSCIFVFATQLSLSLVPRFFSASPLFIKLTLSVFVLLAVVGFGRWCRRLIGVSASAPAFVFFNMFFIWGVYIGVIRYANSRCMDVVFNGVIVMLIIGLCSILSRDPGLVPYGSSDSEELVESSVLGYKADDESSLFLRRIRYCKSCKAYIKGFDHHCPAFGNCIGKNNHVLFMVLLVGFLAAEVSYLVCSSQFARKFQILHRTGFEINLAENLANSTMLFCLLQVLWQGVFLTWHVYCICFNIRTDEWINWKKYPEFQLIVQSSSGEGSAKIRFRNPYDKGILQNVKEFLSLKE